MRKTAWRRLMRATILCVSPFLSVAFAEDQGYWTPDVATVNHVEELLRKMPPPTLGDPVNADPFDSYARYYSGGTDSAGRKVIVASFYSNSMNPKEYPPGMHIGREHMVSTGGGCHHLIVVYDVAEDRIRTFVCYGLG